MHASQCQRLVIHAVPAPALLPGWGTGGSSAPSAQSKGWHQAGHHPRGGQAGAAARAGQGRAGTFLLSLRQPHHRGLAVLYNKSNCCLLCHWLERAPVWLGVTTLLRVMRRGPGVTSPVPSVCTAGSPALGFLAGDDLSPGLAERWIWPWKLARAPGTVLSFGNVLSPPGATCAEREGPQ